MLERQAALSALTAQLADLAAPLPPLTAPPDEASDSESTCSDEDFANAAVTDDAAGPSPALENEKQALSEPAPPTESARAAAVPAHEPPDTVAAAAAPVDNSGVARDQSAAVTAATTAAATDAPSCSTPAAQPAPADPDTAAIQAAHLAIYQPRADTALDGMDDSDASPGFAPLSLFPSSALMPNFTAGKRLVRDNRVKAAASHHALLANTPAWLADHLLLTSQRYLVRGRVCTLQPPAIASPSDCTGFVADAARHAGTHAGVQDLLRAHTAWRDRKAAHLANDYQYEREEYADATAARERVRGSVVATPSTFRSGGAAAFGSGRHGQPSWRDTACRSTLAEDQAVQRVAAMENFVTGPADQTLSPWERLRGAFVNGNNRVPDPVAALAVRCFPSRSLLKNLAFLFRTNFIILAARVAVAACLAVTAAGSLQASR